MRVSAFGREGEDVRTELRMFVRDCERVLRRARGAARKGGRPRLSLRGRAESGRCRPTTQASRTAVGEQPAGIREGELGCENGWAVRCAGGPPQQKSGRRHYGGVGDTQYGPRRSKACQMAGWASMPAAARASKMRTKRLLRGDQTVGWRLQALVVHQGLVVNIMVTERES
jgi:hypothetical protein